jgi:hypothetical protein
MNRTTLTLPMIAALAAVLAVAPASAQGNGHGRGHGKHTEVRRDRDDDDRWDRDGDRDRDVRWERRRAEQRVSSRSARNVPPGWCRGVGNPHRTAANCGYRTDRIYRDRSGTWRDRNGDILRRDGVYRDRNGVLRDRYGRVIGVRTTSRTSGNYSANHTDFHRRLRAECYARADRVSIVNRVRIMNQCNAEHDAWHRRYGR